MLKPTSAKPIVENWSSVSAVQSETTDAWERALSATYGRWEVDKAVQPGFTANIRKREFGELRVVECECDPCTGRRVSQFINRDEAPFIGVQITRSGTERFHLGSQALSVAAGDLVIWTSDQPSEFTVVERLHKVSLVLPWSYVRNRLPKAAKFSGTLLDSRSGIGAVLYSHVDSLARQLELFTEADQAAVERATLELLSAALTPRVEAPQRGLATRYLSQLQAYALRNLQDEELSPASIAKANNMSARYVHLLFAQMGTTVSAWVRQQRLERCREALKSPAHCNSSVSEIAYSWGFTDPSHFSRVFKTTYGISPTGCREGRQTSAPQV